MRKASALTVERRSVEWAALQSKKLMILVKVHKAYRNVVAVCDSELVGKYLEEGKRELRVGEHFFKGEEKTHEEMVAFLQLYSENDSTFNIVGPKSIKAALDAGIITKEGISHIQDVPFALVLL